MLSAFKLWLIVPATATNPPTQKRYNTEEIATDSTRDTEELLRMHPWSLESSKVPRVLNVRTRGPPEARGLNPQTYKKVTL